MKDFLNSMIELNHKAHVNPPSKVILVAKKSKCFGELESLFNRRNKRSYYSKMIYLNNEQKTFDEIDETHNVAVLGDVKIIPVHESLRYFTSFIN